MALGILIFILADIILYHSAVIEAGQGFQSLLGGFLLAFGDFFDFLLLSLTRLGVGYSRFNLRDSFGRVHLFGCLALSWLDQVEVASRRGNYCFLACFEGWRFDVFISNSVLHVLGVVADRVVGARRESFRVTRTSRLLGSGARSWFGQVGVAGALG